MRGKRWRALQAKHGIESTRLETRLKAGTSRGKRMRQKVGLCAICLAATVLLVACNDAEDCRNCNEDEAELCATSPGLRASADDGKATLEWEPAVGFRATPKAWRFRQTLQGETWSLARDTGPAATAYVVSGLTNDKAYTFQVRAQLDAADFTCWSAPVTVVPRKVDNVMAEIEKHQRAIAKRMAALEAIETSMNEIAGQAKGIHDGVDAAATVAGPELVKIRGAIDEVDGNIGKVAEKVVAGLSRIEEKLGKTEPGGEPDICGGGGIAEETSLAFGNNSFKVRLDEDGVLSDEDRERSDVNWENIQSFAEKLNDVDAGLVLTVGRATAIGEDTYNQHLSDQRATCATLCIRKGLGDRAEDFEFREVAKGETITEGDLPGTNPKSRRVDVILCEGTDGEEKQYSSGVSDLTADRCGCGSESFEPSAAEDGI